MIKSCKIYSMLAFILLHSSQAIASLLVNPDIYVTPVSVDFGVSDYVNEEGIRKSVTIENKGRGPLTIARIDIVGDVSDFSVISGAEQTVMSDAMTACWIQFQPFSEGTKNATLRIYSNDPDENPVLVPLTGQCYVTGPLASIFYYPRILDFGTGMNSLTFKIRNDGLSDLRWRVSENPDKAWITSVTPSVGINDATITVIVDRDQLSSDSDTAILAVKSNSSSGHSHDLIVNITKYENISAPSIPSGPASGKVGQELTFSSGGSTSNAEHAVEYQFYWGDGSPSAWGPSTQNHSYSSAGTVSVKARARCQTHTGIVSGWSGTRPVKVEENGSVADILVTNCSDDGPGSLREAIHIANLHTGPDTILFAIPEEVPGYRADAGIWVIQPKSDLPPISDGKLLINGFTQSAFIGRDTNPYGPEIVLDGHLVGYAIGIHVAASKVTLVGLTINNFGLVGIWMDQADNGYVAGCYIGTDYAGLEPAPNGEGINIGEKCHHIYIAPVDTFRNIITGNINCGIHVRSSHAIFLYSNLVGLNRISSAAPGNGCYGGFYIAEHSDSVIAIDNWMCGNTNGALIIHSNHNTIQHNWIGISPQNPDPKPGNLIPLPGNRNDGISIQGESSDNLIYNNVIYQNDGAGVCIYGEQPVRNRISQNCISQNKGPGIFYPSAGANRISAPTITKATRTSVSGTAIPNATIEIYTDAEDEGQIFQGQTQSGADGRFEWTGVIQGSLPHVTAIAIKAEGSTSPFSIQFTTSVEETHTASAPATFTLEQNYPNPFNPDTHIDFDLAHAADVSLMIFDLQGRWISTITRGKMGSGHYSLVWNGQNNQGESVPSGVYLYQLSVGDLACRRKMILVK